jgi:4'-phosphopantetheinyl transferase
MPNHVVDIWWSDLRAMDRRLLAHLDPVEARRAEGIASAADLGRFVVGAVLLRVAVAAATGQDPRAVSIDRTCDECGGAHGRPRVAGLHVSVAHAGPLVLVATSPHPVGVDVEALDRGPDVETWVRDEATFKAADRRAGVLDLTAPLRGFAAALATVDGAEVTVHPTEESAQAQAEVKASGPGSASP